MSDCPTPESEVRQWVQGQERSSVHQIWIPWAMQGGGREPRQIAEVRIRPGAGILKSPSACEKSMLERYNGQNWTSCSGRSQAFLIIAN